MDMKKKKKKKGLENEKRRIVFLLRIFSVLEGVSGSVSAEHIMMWSR